MEGERGWPCHFLCYTLSVNKCLVREVPVYCKDYFMLHNQNDNQPVRCTRSLITDIMLPKCRGITKGGPGVPVTPVCEIIFEVNNIQTF